MTVDWTYKLLRYAQEQCDEAEAAEVYAQLRQSPELMAQYRAIQRLGARFEEYWAGFAPEGRRGHRIAIVIRGALDAVRRIGIAIAEEADALGVVHVRLVPAYRGVADPFARPEVRGAMDQASSALRAGLYQASLDAVETAALFAPKLHEDLPLAIKVDGESVGELHLLPTEGRIVVRVGESVPGRWMLFLEAETESVRLPLEDVEGTPFRATEIVLPNGAFHILLEQETA